MCWALPPRLHVINGRLLCMQWTYRQCHSSEAALLCVCLTFFMLCYVALSAWPNRVIWLSLLQHLTASSGIGGLTTDWCVSLAAGVSSGFWTARVKCWPSVSCCPMCCGVPNSGSCSFWAMIFLITQFQAEIFFYTNKCIASISCARLACLHMQQLIRLTLVDIVTVHV
jgi:hypothetical protein